VTLCESPISSCRFSSIAVLEVPLPSIFVAARAQSFSICNKVECFSQRPQEDQPRRSYAKCERRYEVRALLLQVHNALVIDIENPGRIESSVKKGGKPWQPTLDEKRMNGSGSPLNSRSSVREALRSERYSS
jgi:hypothetical protein